MKFNMKTIPKFTKPTPERISKFQLPDDIAEKELLRLATIAIEWKSKKQAPKGCLHGAFTVRTNIGLIPHGATKSTILAAFRGTGFRITGRGRFSRRRNERLWSDSINLGEYLKTQPEIVVDRRRDFRT